MPQDVLLLEELRRSSSKSVTNGWRTYLAGDGSFSHADSLSFKVTPCPASKCYFRLYAWRYASKFYGAGYGAQRKVILRG